jgi:two-component system chemotaxis response regulator CheY
MVEVEKVKLLATDDDPSIRALLCAILKQAGYEVISAENGAEALEKLAENPDVKLIILDWMMPVMDGMALLRELQLQPCPPPALILSARGSQKDIKEALHAGASDYTMKPLNKDELLFKVGNLLQLGRDGAKVKAARRKPVSLAASTSLILLRFDEKSCVFRSTFPVPVGSTLFFQSDSLSLSLDMSLMHRFTAKTTSCVGKGNNYRIEAELVGITQAMARTIHDVGQRSAWRR